MTKRDEALDIAKGIGIFLVVAGHIIEYNSYFSSIIFSFHMPLFFFISGMLLKGTDTFTEYLKKKADSLIKPYFVFIIVGLVFTLLIPYYRTSLADVTSLKMYLYLGKPEVVHVGQMWFLLNLFMCELIFWFWEKVFGKKEFGLKVLSIGILPVIAFIYTLIAHVFPYGDLPFTIGVLPMSLFFVLMGYLSKDVVKNINNNILNAVVCIVCGIMTFAFEHKLNGFVNISDTKYNNISYYILFAFSGIIFIITLSKILCGIKNKQFIVFVGRNTLPIMGVHSLFIYIVTWLLSIKMNEPIYNGCNIPKDLWIPIILFVFFCSCGTVQIYNKVREKI